MTLLTVKPLRVHPPNLANLWVTFLYTSSRSVSHLNHSPKKTRQMPLLLADEFNICNVRGVSCARALVRCDLLSPLDLYNYHFTTESSWGSVESPTAGYGDCRFGQNCSDLERLLGLKDAIRLEATAIRLEAIAIRFPFHHIPIFLLFAPALAGPAGPAGVSSDS